MTKDQQKFADDFLEKNPHCPELFLNPEKGEWFTDKDFAINSLGKDKDGKVTGKIETAVKTPKAKQQAGKDTKDKTADTTAKSGEDKTGAEADKGEGSGTDAGTPGVSENKNDQNPQ